MKQRLCVYSISLAPVCIGFSLSDVIDLADILFASLLFHLSSFFIQHGQDMFQHFFRLKIVNKEHYSLTIFIKKIFCKIPFNVVFGSLLLEILEDRAGIFTNHFLLFNNGERDLICFEKPGPNLFV